MHFHTLGSEGNLTPFERYCAEKSVMSAAALTTGRFLSSHAFIRIFSDGCRSFGKGGKGTTFPSFLSQRMQLME